MTHADLYHALGSNALQPVGEVESRARLTFTYQQVQLCSSNSKTCIMPERDGFALVLLASFRAFSQIVEFTLTASMFSKGFGCTCEAKLDIS